MIVRSLNHPIRAYRQRHQLSLQELADQIGISHVTLHRLEHNYGQPVPRRIIAFCEKNDISPSVFYPPDPERESLQQVS